MSALAEPPDVDRGFGQETAEGIGAGLTSGIYLYIVLAVVLALVAFYLWKRSRMR